MNEIYICMFAGHPVRYYFLFPRTRKFMSNKLTRYDGTHYDIRMAASYFQRCKDFFRDEQDEAFIESKGLISLTSQYLLKYGCCIFHSVAIAVNGQAWLLCGPSGTGKTTQYRNWINMYPEEIQIISGDMPLLEMKPDHTIHVHPSCWNGKEGFGSDLSAPLGGLIMLKQGSENRIEKADIHETVVSTFRQFRTVLETDQEIRILSKMVDCIYRNYPVYMFINQGDCNSTKILRKLINK